MQHIFTGKLVVLASAVASLTATVYKQEQISI